MACGTCLSTCDFSKSKNAPATIIDNVNFDISHTESGPAVDSPVRSPSSPNKQTKRTQSMKVIEKLVGAENEDQDVMFVDTQSMEEEEEEKKPHWVESKAFNIAVGIAVILNAIQIGVELDVDLDVFGEVLENFFCALWLLEMIAKIFVKRIGYFKSPWNILDFALAWMTIIDVWCLQLIYTDGSGGLKRMSVLRALRLVRLVRLVKALKAFEELWLLVNGLIQAFRVLTWVFIMFFIIIYVSAIFVTSLIGKNCKYASEEEFSDCSSLFGTLMKSMMTVFQIITMDGWSDVLRPVSSFQPAMLLFFFFLVLVTSFGLMNIVMGVIVEQTIEHAHKNEEKLALQREIQQAKDLIVLKDIFEEADKDGGGKVTLSEFIDICERKDVVQMFKELNLPVSRPRLATRLFEVLDGNMHGAIEIEDFLTATIRLKQEGRQLQKDQTLLLMETRHLARRLTRIEERIGTLPASRAPDSPKDSKENSQHSGGLVLQVNDGGKVQVNQALPALPSPLALQDQEVGNSAIIKELKSFIQSEVGSLKEEMQGIRTQISRLEKKR